MKKNRKKASTLVFTLSILMMLSIMGITFINLAMVESKATTNKIYSLNAQFVAEAGIQNAVAKLRNDFSRELVGVNKDWMYYKPDSGATENPLYDETLYAEDNIGTGVSLETMMTYSDSEERLVSYKYFDADKDENYVEVGNQKHFVSGYVTHKRHIYGLKIIDCSSQINLNMQVDASVTTTKTLATILNNLSQAIALRSGVGGGMGLLKVWGHRFSQSVILLDILLPKKIFLELQMEAIQLKRTI